MPVHSPSPNVGRIFTTTIMTRTENEKCKPKCVFYLDNIDFYTPIYRVFPVDRLIELFSNNLNTLVRTILWDDPFENFILKQNAVTPDGVIVKLSEHRDSFYGQCWTLNFNETDALWRIYSPEKNGVRVQTTLGKLWNSFYNLDDPLAVAKYHIGKIQYQNSNEIKNFFEQANLLEYLYSDGAQGMVKTLLIKRTEFTHENEVRLIYRATDKIFYESNKIFQYQIDACNLWDELLFDPRFDDKDFLTHCQTIRDFGFTKSISQSELYKLPQFKLTVNIK
jgi:hypothetical protein